jgi:hypothetical protein
MRYVPFRYGAAGGSPDLATMVRWTVEKIAHPAGRAALAGLLGESPDELAPRRVDVVRVTSRVVDRLDRAKAAGEIRPDRRPPDREGAPPR